MEHETGLWNKIKNLIPERTKSPKLRVDNIVHDNDSIATVIYSDKYRADFVGYKKGSGYGIEGLKSMTLHDQNNSEIFRYNGRLHVYGPQEDEERIVTISEGYTQQQIADYWRVTSSYLEQKYKRQPNLRLPWKIIHMEGQRHLSNLEAGTVKSLTD